MTAAELVSVLLEGTVASSAAIVLVLLVRQPLRRYFGAAAGYGAWAMVPAAIVAVLLPAMEVPAGAVAKFGGVVATDVAPVAGSVRDVLPPGGLVLAWAAGLLAMGARLFLQQRAFVRALGTLRQRPDGMHQAMSVAGLPAVVGLLRPRIVLPADFDARYTPAQRDLLQAHERLHVVRGDLWTNALVAVLRCAFWFNPLVHAAARCFRHDQELACDQVVLARHPASRRAYAEAMFDTQLAAQALPLGCHWGFGHPLKERIAMLKQPVPSRRRWISGTVLAVVLASLAGVAAWAAQPPVAKAGDKVPPVGADDPARALTPPKYPAAAIAQNITGKVVLLIDIDAHGKPTAVVVERAEPAGVFEAEAVAAAWNWKFSPAIEHGRPVASRVRVPVEFEADGTPPGEAGTAARGSSA